MNHPKQHQHKIPQVYLKQFGYVNSNKQWKVSVKEVSDTFTRQKSIKSFTAMTNVFDIDSQDPVIRRIFEKLNCDLENGYHEIIADLESNGKLSDKSYAFLLQLIANLLIRSDYWRDTVLELLNSAGKEIFLRHLTIHHCESEQERKNIDQQPFFRVLIESSPEEALNRVMLYFMHHLMERLWHYELVIIKSQEGKSWWTSTNPVVVHNRIDGLEMLAMESELYFPISPTYLAYLHFEGSSDQENPLRTLMTNEIHEASDDLNEHLQHLILENPSDCIILAGEYKYRKEDETD